MHVANGRWYKHYSQKINFMNNEHELLERFSSGLITLALELPLENQKKLIEFIKLLFKWNQHYNLTGIKNLSKMIGYHLLDSLAVAPFIAGKSIADVGTGAGFPGIPLAVYYPDKKFTLIEPIGKKNRFLIQACNQLGIKNVEIIPNRAEELQACSYIFDCILSRALGSLSHFITITSSLSSKNTRWIAMKGLIETTELEEINGKNLHYQIINLQIPEVESERNLIIVEK